jgi:putative toxin-antitoxin system antitoxin component (TIGR02293 family)
MTAATVPASTRRNRPAHRSAAPGIERARHASPIERVEMVKSGVPAAGAVALAQRMGVSREQFCRTLGLGRATLDRKLRSDGRLSPDESSRVLGLDRLVDRAQTLVEDAGDAAGFDAARWAAAWLEQPLPALGGRRPGEFMDTAEGQQIVLQLLDQAGSGAYA